MLVFCSAIRIARVIPDDAILYSVENSATAVAVSNGMVKYAGLSHKVISLPGNIAKNLQDLKETVGQADIVFLDHLKTVYLSDLKVCVHFLSRSSACIIHDVRIFSHFSLKTI